MRGSLTLLLLAACNAAGGPTEGGPGAGPAVQVRRPNLVLVLADDAGLECFGSYGGESYATPRIDRMAAEGVQFDHCYSQPLCTPSRVKLLTGRGNLRNYTRFSILDPNEVTVAELLRDAGYATGVFGKWQLLGAEHYGALAGTGTHPRDAGFDTWCLWQVETLGSRYHDPQVDRDGVLETLEGSYGPDVSVDALLAFAAEPREDPFFAWYPMALPHDPFDPTPGAPEGQDRATRFAAMIGYVDRQVGRILDGLEDLGLADDTLVLFTSDNGTHRSITSRAWGREVQGGKTRSTNAGTHVPLIAWGAGVADPGRHNGDLVDLSDLLPTLCEVASAELPADRVLDGLSFAPQLRGEIGTPRAVLTQYSNPRPPGSARNPRARWARDHRYKLYDDGRLVDCVNDPDELEALALGVEPEGVRARLQAALDAMPPEPEHLRGK